MNDNSSLVYKTTKHYIRTLYTMGTRSRQTETIKAI